MGAFCFYFFFLPIKSCESVIILAHWVLSSIGSGTPQSATQAISLPCANIFNGRYRYLEDLMQLSAAATPSQDLRWPQYHTPIEMDRLSVFLSSHPDQAFAAYIHQGLTHGFRIGFNSSFTQLQSRSSNHPSALANGSIDILQPHALVSCTDAKRSWHGTTATDVPCQLAQPLPHSSSLTDEEQVRPIHSRKRPVSSPVASPMPIEKPKRRR